MSLILKQEPANTIATPPAGKSTLFVDDNSVMSVKNPAGTVTTFPTVQGSNTQVFFNDEGAINGSANLSFVKTTNTLTVTNGNVVATGVKTDNLYYANGSPWDLQQPAGSNGQIQFNDNDSFGASANLTFNGTSLNTTANLNVTGNAYISGNLTVDGNVVYVNVESLSVEDPLIALGGGPNGNALTSNNGYDRGLILHNYTTQAVDAFMGWDTSNAEFSFASNATVSGEVVTINTLGNIRANRIAGTLSTAAQPNITSVGTLTGLLIGSTATQADFPNAKAIISQDNSGQTHSENIGVVGEAVADSGNTSTWGIGVLGEARANGATKATGVQGGGYVTNSADSGAAVGVRGYSIQTHSGGYNIGVLGNASGSGLGSYAFYVQAGNIGSIETATNWDLVDNSPAALTFQSSGKANIFGIETTDGAEGIYTQGYLNVTGNAAVGGVLTDNYYYANGSPVDFQQAGGSNTQIQFNDADSFGGSAAFTFNKTSNTVQIGGTLSVVANATAGNIITAGVVTATGNVTGGNLVTSGKVIATGNVESQANLYAAGNVAATGNVTGGNISTAGTLSAGGNANVGNLGTAGVFATTLSSTGNANVGNLGTGGLVTATGNIRGGNLVSLGKVTSNGDIESGGNAIIESQIFVGNNAYLIPLNNPVLIGSATATDYVQGALVNKNGNGSADWVAYGDNGNTQAGWSDFGFTGSTFNDANYTITGKNDGYFFVQSVNGTGLGGNLVLATGSEGANNDIVFATGGFLAANEKMRFVDAQGSFKIKTTTVSTTTATGALVVSGGVGIAGNIYSGGLVSATGNITGGNLTTTGTANVGNLNVTGNVTSALLPSANVTYDLGSPTQRWKDLYLANSTIYLGNATMTGNGNSVTTSGNLTSANLITAGILSVGGNANVGNLGTAGLITATGNIGGGNINTGGVVSATGNITGGNLVTGGVISVTGNANIGNIGTGGLITATGNITGGNLVTGGLITATGNITGGNLVTGGQVSATGNGTFGNVSATTFTGSLSGAATTAGTVTTAAQPNITSVGTLTSVSVSGNANIGNIGTGGLITATGNITGGNLVTGGAISATGNANVGNVGTAGLITATGNVIGGNLVTAGILSVTGTGVSSINGNLNMNSKYVVSVSDPVNLQDVATKNYVDTKVSSGISYHQPVAVATTTTLATATGGTTSYNSPNGAANGIGAYISTTGTFLNIDGANVQTVGTRILVKDEANAAWNGVYTYSNTTAITRATDADEYGPDSSEQLSVNDYFFCQGGIVNEGVAFIVASPSGTITFGTSNITFSVFSTSQVYNAGTGIAITGTVISANASQTQITAVGTLTTLSVSGNANIGNIGTAGIITATGNITGGNVIGTLLTGTLTTAAQPNITSVGTLTSVSVSGNANIGNIGTAGIITATGNANVGNIGANNAVFTLVTGTLVTAAQPNVTSTGTLTTLSVSGNANIGNIGTAGLITATGNISGANINGTFYGAGTGLTSIPGANVTGQVGNALVSGTVYTNAQPNITSLGTLTGLTIGNATSNSVFGNGTITLNAGLITGNGAGLSQLAGGNVTGQVGNALVAGTVYTAAQPNITSVGTLTSVSVSGNANIGNIGTAGVIVSSIATGTAPFTVTSTTQVANLNVATAGVAGTVTAAAQPNITSLGTLSSLSVSGNANVGNIGATLFVGTLATAAQPNITSVGTLTSLAVTGNISAANVTATHYGAATGLTGIPGANITGTIPAGVVPTLNQNTTGYAATVSGAAQSNITSVGTLTGLTFANASTITANNVTFTTGANTNAGTFTGNFSLSAGSKLNATYADLAEKYVADAKYEPGTVLVFGGVHEVTLSTEEDSTRVAGVVTTNPAYSMNSACEGEHVAEIALQGRVPVKVLGPVSKGDLLVSSANGYATANNLARAGTIIGKSLENFSEASGVIEVAVGRF